MRAKAKSGGEREKRENWFFFKIILLAFLERCFLQSFFEERGFSRKFGFVYCLLTVRERERLELGRRFLREQGDHEFVIAIQR